MTLTKKQAVLSIDVEDWYHLDYIHHRSRSNYSMLDGLDNFISICHEYCVPATYFFLGELAGDLRNRSADIEFHSGEIAMHGADHTRPMLMSVKEFDESLKKGKDLLQESFGKSVLGYRAPCFSLDKVRLESVRDAGFRYDSSKIDFNQHPLYGSIQLPDFDRIASNVYLKDDFFEFEIPTYKVLGKSLPISGGGYIRIIPWQIIKALIQQYIKREDTFFIFLHPFEMSSKPVPHVEELSVFAQFRFGYNTFVTPLRLKKLIEMLKDEGFEFTSFISLTEKF